MKRLDRYVLFSFLGPFILTFSIVLFILAMQFLWLYIDELVGKGLSFGVIMEFMAWGSATLLPMVLPLATLLASIMTLGGMGESNELLAIKSAGISLERVLRPLTVVAVLISIGAFFISNDLIPVAYKKIYALRDDIGRTKSVIKIPTGIFYDGIDGYMLRVDHDNDETGLMYDIMVYDHNGGMGNNNLTVADSGSIRVSDDGATIIFRLFNGTSYQEENSFRSRDTTLKQDIITFDEQTMIVSRDDYSFERGDEDRFGNEIMSKDLKQLSHDRDSLTREFADVRPSNIRRFTYANVFKHMSQIDTSLLAYKNLNKGEEWDFKAWKDSVMTTRTIRDLELTDHTLESVESQKAALSDYDRNTYRYVSPIRKMKIEEFRKFTLSLACLLFFFIGAPLGSILRKGGLGTPVIVSSLIFMLYWVVDISGKKLARDGAISPFEGSFISSAVLLPVGMLLLWAAIREKRFNFDAIKFWFRNFAKKADKVLRKASGYFKKNRGIIKVVYMGTPEFAVGPLKALIENEYEISAVVTVPDKQSGRGLKVNQSAVKQFALERGLPILQPVSLKDPEFLAQLKALDADMFVVVAFRMLPREVWQMPRLGTFNLHASLLPRYRGAAPINWAIINGEKQTGVTTFLIDEQIDTGNIIFSVPCTIEDYDTAGSLSEKLMVLGSELVVKTADALSRGKAKPQEQDSFARLIPAPKITKETCHIDWSIEGYRIVNLIRGLAPSPAAYTTVVNNGAETSMKIFEAYVYMDDEPAAPGTVITDGRSYLGIACGSHTVRLLEVQLAGKKRMQIADFLRGWRPAEDCKFI
ncbi:MAG: methionyl-tRNA formyltransferase [Bacteroidales bacterium]|nr:methionyl-tRNA formyltransferase [Bacteroidales bacterium]